MEPLLDNGALATDAMLSWARSSLCWESGRSVCERTFISTLQTEKEWCCPPRSWPCIQGVFSFDKGLIGIRRSSSGPLRPTEGTKRGLCMWFAFTVTRQPVCVQHRQHKTLRQAPGRYVFHTTAGSDKMEVWWFLRVCMSVAAAVKHLNATFGKGGKEKALAWPGWWASWRCRGRRAVWACSSFSGTACRNPAASGQPRPGSWSEWTAARLCLHPRCPRWWGWTVRRQPATALPARPLTPPSQNHQTITLLNVAVH